MKKSIFALICLTASTSLFAQPQISKGCYTEKAYGLSGHAIQAQSSHDIEIINDEDSSKSFNYIYKICVQNHGCKQKQNNVTVNAHSKWNNHSEVFHMETYKYAGPYEITATTEVDGSTCTAKSILIVRE